MSINFRNRWAKYAGVKFVRQLVIVATSLSVFSISTAYAQVGGLSLGLSRVSEIVCENLTTNKIVKLRNPNNTSWDCSNMGLTTNFGDIIKQSVKGYVDYSKNVGGSVFGVTDITRLRCENISTRRRISITPPTADWSCSNNGLRVRAGNLVNQTIQGTVSVFDHNAVIGPCVTCHNGFNATGKPSNHATTTNVCDACHITTSWVAIILPMDHTQIAGTCVTCHVLGGVATAKSVAHPSTTNLCDACHTTTSWINLVLPFDHSQTISGCESCHNNVIATGKPSFHQPTTLSCDTCHTTTAWLPAF